MHESIPVYLLFIYFSITLYNMFYTFLSYTNNTTYYCNKDVMLKKSCINLIRIHEYLKSNLPLFKSATLCYYLYTQ